jgi:hypothetical protein
LFHGLLNKITTEPFTLMIVCHDMAFFTTRSCTQLSPEKYDRLEPAVTKGAEPEGRKRTRLLPPLRL